MKELEVFFAVRQGERGVNTYIYHTWPDLTHITLQHTSNHTEEEERVLEQKRANPLRSYLGLTDDEEAKRIRKRALIDRDLYGDLRR